MSNATTTTASRKLIASWSDDIKVGIYDSKWSVRVYEDRALLVMPTVKWVGQTGGYHEIKSRITGRDLSKLLAIAKSEIEDDAVGEYTEQVKEIIWGAQY